MEFVKMAKSIAFGFLFGIIAVGILPYLIVKANKKLAGSRPVNAESRGPQLRA
ncbi:hypothetical protein [Paenibacillus sp. MBLB4367]|uniref:hypothetical protein n=1 Tax=Paenibacillus sp. MBLB4367 TaxID=3384767 RepID=UPI003907EEFE